MKAKISDKARQILGDEELSRKVMNAISKGELSTSVWHEGKVITVRRVSAGLHKAEPAKGKEARGR